MPGQDDRALAAGKGLDLPGELEEEIKGVFHGNSGDIKHHALSAPTGHLPQRGGKLISWLPLGKLARMRLRGLSVLHENRAFREEPQKGLPR